MHVLPPLFRVELEEELLSDLLVEKLPSVGRFIVEVVEGAVGGALIAVGAGTGIAADGGVDQLEVDVVLDLGVELTEALDETVGLPVVCVETAVLA
jgi:hypothetical protein